MINIGIIGNGFVGKATNILKNDNIKLFVYDIEPSLCIPVGMNLKKLCNECHVIFISVPTPMNKNGSCYLNIVESVVQDISIYCDLNEKLVVIRSTVPVGTSDNLNCYFMPEFLTEKTFEKDFINNKDWIFGCKGTEQDKHFKKIITKIFTSAYNAKKITYNNVNFVSTGEAEMIKLFRNNFLSTKISFCNEMAQFCKIKGIEYENVRKLAAKDDRIGESHTNVPGHDGEYGFGGTCFPKDTNSLLYEMNKNNMKSYIVDATVKRNENVDRKKKDWELNKGRCVV